MRGPISGFGARIAIFTISREKFEISKRNERKPQPQVAWPVAMFIKDNLYDANVQEDGAVSQMAARFKPRIANSI